jgi:hypothetical protein
MFHSRISKIVLAVVALVVLSSMAFAFAAANTVPQNLRAGDGNSGAISGYEVSDVSYTYNADDHGLIDEVDFTLSAAANHVQIQLVTDGPYYDCTVSGGTTVACDTTAGTQATVDDTNIFRVIASNNIAVATPAP